MLTYLIKRHTETANIDIGKPLTVKDYLTRKQILANNLSRCHFNVGDPVKFKKPRSNPAKGTIVNIEDDHTKVTFSHGGMCPMNIVIRLEDGKTEVKTNMKKILLTFQGGRT